MYLIEIEHPKKGQWLRSGLRNTLDEAKALCEHLRSQGFTVRYQPRDDADED